MADGLALMDGGDWPAHYDDLASVEAEAWRMLCEGASSRRAAFHQATVATRSLEGLAAARTVVLRGADPDAATLRFHTDRRSQKFAELTAEPRCEMHLYDHDAKVQVRARGSTRLHHADGRTEAIWTEMREMSKACYRQPAGPGAPLADPAEVAGDGPLSDHEGYLNFVIVELRVSQLEWLYLAAAGHRRALIAYDDRKRLTWLAP